RVLVARGSGAALFLVAGLALADPPAREPAKAARLVYTRGRGAEQCPDEAAVESAVSARLGDNPFQPAADRTVSATVRLAGGMLRAEVLLRDARGTTLGARLLEAANDDCAELVRVMTLAISLAIDPRSASSPAPPGAPSSPS